MENLFYRFRTIEQLLDKYDELENQEIYFARPDELNDPMEGYRDFIWQGDTIIWKSFIKHYLLCLERMCSILALSGEKYEMSADQIPVFIVEDDFPTPQYKELFNKITDCFFQHTELNDLVTLLASRSTPIRRNELILLLSAMHPIALKVILTEFESAGFISQRISDRQFADHLLKDIINSKFIESLEETLLKEAEAENAINILFDAYKTIQDQTDLIHRYSGMIDNSKKNNNLVQLEFPEIYVKQLEKLVYPPWYTACFMSDCRNSSIWGHYADNHKGVCLIFRTERQIIKLTGINGWSYEGPLKGARNQKFYPIDYTRGYGQIDFFRSLGRVQVGKLKTFWYSDGSRTSICADEIFSSEKQWQEKYWENFFRDITVKANDWKYENEYRLILASAFDDFKEEENRKLHYDFKSLVGIIFGINTSREDKIRIMKIIDDKCSKHDREDFKFYQAYYSADEGCINHEELSLIKYKNDQSK